MFVQLFAFLQRRPACGVPWATTEEELSGAPHAMDPREQPLTSRRGKVTEEPRRAARGGVGRGWPHPLSGLRLLSVTIPISRKWFNTPSIGETREGGDAFLLSDTVRFAPPSALNQRAVP